MYVVYTNGKKAQSVIPRTNVIVQVAYIVLESQACGRRSYCTWTALITIDDRSLEL